MRLNSVLILISLVILSFVCDAQVRMRISEVNYSSQFTALHDTRAKLVDFMTLASSSLMLQNDFSDYSYTNFYSSSNFYSISNFKLGLEFYGDNTGKFLEGTKLYFGVFRNRSSFMSGRMMNSQRMRSDTLISVGTGTIYFTDTVIEREYNMDYYFEQIGISLSALYFLKPEKRWSFYGGFDFKVGFSIKSITDIIFSEDIKLQTRNAATNFYFAGSSLNSYSENENIDNEPNRIIFAGLPLGINFRIGKNRDFWKQFHLYYEFKPCLSAIIIPELNRTYTNTFVFSGMGIRYKW